MISKDKPIYDFVERDRLIWENFNDLIIVAEPMEDFKIEYINEDSFKHLLGYTNKDLMGKSFLKYIHSDDLIKYKDLYNKYAFDDQVREVRIIAKKGNYLWADFKIKLFRNNKNQQKLFIILRDISKLKELELKLEKSVKRFEKITYFVPEIKELKLTEQRLRESEEKYRKILEAIPDTFYLLSADSTVIECKNYDPKTEIFFKPEYLGKKVQEFLPVTMAKIVANNTSKTIDTQEPQTAEFTARINNDFFTAEGRFLYLSQDRVGLFLRTITEKKKLEIKLRKSEEKYRKIVNNISDAIVEFDSKGEITYFSPQSYDIFGFQPKELIGLSALKFVHPDDLNSCMNALLHVVKTRGSLNMEFRGHHKNGFYVPISARGTLIEENGKIRIVGVLRDITERKLNEQKLKESEEKYRLISENANDLIIVFNEKFEYEYINENVHKRILGYTKNDLIGKIQLPYIHSDDRKQTLIATGSILRKGKGSHSIRFKHKDGSYKWLEITGKNFVDSKGIKKTLAIARDITNRKEAEEKLKESEAKYHELFETSPDGVILTDIKGNILECNSALEKISDYTIDEFVGKNFRDLEIYHENALDILLKGYNDLFGNKNLPYVEFPIKRKDNNISWVQLSSTLIDMKGEKFILVVIHNITSQKQAEEALRKSEEKYRDLLETSSLGVIEIDVKNIKMTYINPKLLDIVGYTREDLSEEIFRNDLIHEKDLAKLLRTNEEAELEFRIIDKQGKEKWLSGKRIPHFNDKGEIISIRVWLDDITEKKLYETLIYELNINFLNFTANIQKNIELLLNTGLKLLNGDIILYIHEIKSDKQIRYQIITSENKIFTFDEKEFSENLFFNELFHEGHDFPQTFFDIHMKKYAKTDPFIKDYEIKGCFGKVIKSHNGFSSAVCVFYKENPIITGQEKLVMFLICDAIEIEQRRWQVQRDLEEQNITLNKINKLKTELFSRTSHELKTPLISIKGFTELLLTLHHSKFDPEVKSILEEIKEGSKRLQKIINILLESTKLEAGQLELNPSEEDLIFLIKFCVKELRGLATLRDQSISLDLHQILNTKFDKERIYEVISNLLVNAIKYTPPGGHIQIKSEIKDSEYIISIQDNGIGFMEEEKSQVFKQFGKIERYGQGWDISTEGSGLGLYITKKLIELHGGKIWLESKGRNKGSTFYFSIPKK